jgi:tape measure domain-containing protein
MAVELAVAYITVAMRTNDLAKAITSGLSGADKQAQDTGRAMGSKMSAGLGYALKASGVSVLGAAGTALGVAFTAGFSRLKAIDDAKAKLTALGNSAQAVASIMDSALAAVKGTAFSLGDAATIAASAVAAGVKPGQDLTKYLSTTADAASVAGTSLGDMGSIINKVRTNQVAYTDDLQQLADRGLPIFQWLATAYGVNAAQFRKMVEGGKVDSATFLSVIEKNIGGAALKSANSFSGSLANTMAAVGRFGATLLGPVFNAVPPLLGKMTKGIDAFGSRIGPLSSSIGGFISTALGKFSSLDFGAIGGKLAGVFTAIWPSVEHFGSSLGNFATAVGPLVVGFFNAILPVVQLVAGLFLGLGQVALPALITAFSWFLGAGAAVLNWFREHAGLVGTIAAVIGGALLPSLVALGVQMTVTAAKFLLMNGAQIAMTAWSAATRIATGVQAAFNLVMSANPIGIVITAIAALTAGLIWFFTQTEVGRKAWGVIWEAMKTAVTATWTGIKWVFDQIGSGLNFLGDIASKIGGGFRSALSGLADLLKSPLHLLGRFLSMLPRSVFGIEIPGVSTLHDWGGTLQGLRSGGVAGRTAAGALWGPGTGTSDSILGISAAGVPMVRVAHGEGIVRADVMRRGGSAIVAMLNGLPGLAAGGTVSLPTMMQLIEFAKGVEGMPYDWGGVHWGDCSGAVAGLANFVAGLGPWDTRFSTADEGPQLVRRGFSLGLGGAGTLSIGWYVGGPYGGHTAATLPNGVHFEMGGVRGNGQYGGGAAGANDPAFTDHAFWAWGGPAPKIDLGTLPGSTGPGTTTGPGASGTAAAPDTSDNVSPMQKRQNEIFSSISENFGNAAKEFVSGQITDALGVFGAPDNPPILAALNAYQKSSEKFEADKKAQSEWEAKHGGGTRSPGPLDSPMIADPNRGIEQFLALPPAIRDGFLKRMVPKLMDAGGVLEPGINLVENLTGAPEPLIPGELGGTHNHIDARIMIDRPGISMDEIRRQLFSYQRERVISFTGH